MFVYHIYIIPLQKKKSGFYYPSGSVLHDGFYGRLLQYHFLRPDGIFSAASPPEAYRCRSDPSAPVPGPTLGSWFTSPTIISLNPLQPQPAKALEQMDVHHGHLINDQHIRFQRIFFISFKSRFALLSRPDCSAPAACVSSFASYQWWPPSSVWLPFRYGAARDIHSFFSK